MDLKEMMKISEKLCSIEASKIVEYLYTNPGASEFDVSDELGASVAKVRSNLYDLKGKNLIDYTRKKDKKKGWYLYYWRVVEKNFEIVFNNDRKERLQHFQERLKEEEESCYYICPNFCKRLDFEVAIENQFLCPICGSLMNEENKERKTNMLKKNIEECKSIISF